MRRAEFKNSGSMDAEMQLTASATNQGADSSRLNPFFTDQCSFGVPMMADLPNAGITVMQDNLKSSAGILDTLGSDLHVPADFDWVNSKYSPSGYEMC